LLFLTYIFPSPTLVLPLPEGGGGFEENPPPPISSPSQREGEDLGRKERGRIWECPFSHWIVTYFCRSTKICYTYKGGGRKGKREEKERIWKKNLKRPEGILFPSKRGKYLPSPPPRRGGGLRWGLPTSLPSLRGRLRRGIFSFFKEN